MNENLFRPKFDKLKLSDKLWLMQRLAAHYNMTFKELYAFSRWGQSCITGIFEKAGREFVFVPGDTVTLGWDRFVTGLNKESKGELNDFFKEFEIESSPEEFISENMTDAASDYQAHVGGTEIGGNWLGKCFYERSPHYCASGMVGKLTEIL